MSVERPLAQSAWRETPGEVARTFPREAESRPGRLDSVERPPIDPGGRFHFQPFSVPECAVAKRTGRKIRSLFLGHDSSVVSSATVSTGSIFRTEWPRSARQLSRSPIFDGLDSIHGVDPGGPSCPRPERYGPGPPRGLNHAWNRTKLSVMHASFRRCHASCRGYDRRLSFFFQLSEPPRSKFTSLGFTGPGLRIGWGVQ